MMLLWILAYLGGLLTILSPCILPVLPFVLSRAEQPFRRNGLPLLAGMAAMFAFVSTLTVVGGGWVVRASEWGRWLALGVLSLFALTLLSPTLAEWISRPFTRLGGTLHRTQSERQGILNSFLLGMATGLLWAPCAGPILGLILTSAALRGANVGTTFLLWAYALGAATSLALALLAGHRVLQGLRSYLGADAWVRRFMGVAVLFGVVAIARGWDRGTLTHLSRLHTENTEQSLIRILRPTPPAAESTSLTTETRTMPELDGAIGWINSPALTRESLRDKVVLIDFWTYSCINCLRSLPYIKAWHEKYKHSGLVVIGVHTPEFAFEKNPAHVRKAVRELGVLYPVALDSDYKIWNAFSNQYWPAHYFIDRAGRIRHIHFGEGEYEASEQILQQLLAATSSGKVPTGTVNVRATGLEAPSLSKGVGSPETYIGYNRAENQVSNPPLRRDQPVNYQLPKMFAENQWGLSGRWKIQAEKAVLLQAPGKIIYRFHARDLHLVLGSGTTAKSIPFIVRLDGKRPGDDHGSDIDADGHGRIQGHRLYQLIRQQSNGVIQDRFFEIEFLEPGAQAYAFTFG